MKRLHCAVISFFVIWTVGCHQPDGGREVATSTSIQTTPVVLRGTAGNYSSITDWGRREPVDGRRKQATPTSADDHRVGIDVERRIDVAPRVGRPCSLDLCGFCRADINHDGAVNVTDLNLLLAAWGTNDPLAEQGCDNTINTTDLLRVLADWGSVP